MQCSHCKTMVAPDARHCPTCGQPISAAAPTPPSSDRAQALQEQAAAAAQQTWTRIQSAGPAKVGLGLIALSAVVGLIFSGQRSIWASGWPEIILALLVIGYVGVRELTGQDPLARFWYAPLIAVGYVTLWGVSEFRLKLGSILFLAGALLLAWTYFWPLREYARSAGLNFRYALYGYRRSVLVGGVVALFSLLFTWIPDQSTSGWWSGGYSYSSYYGGYVYDTMKWYNPGFYFPSYKGYALTGSVILLALLLGCLFYAAFAPQFAVPKWYRNLPLITVGYGLLFLLYTGSISWGQPLFLVGAGLIGWGGYQLGVKGIAEGKGDLRELPLEKWLAKWL